jgi:hypothetical protein
MPVATRGPRFWLPLVAAVSVATFSVGLAAGSHLPRAAGELSVRAGAQSDVARTAIEPGVTQAAGEAARHASRGLAMTPVLDVTAPYLTIQRGVIVPGHGLAMTPVLDVTAPYLTIQRGVIVPGH